MERILRQRWRRRRRKQLDGGRDMPRVSSPSYPSDWQGRPLPSKQNHQFLLRKDEEEEKKSLPLNDVGCVSYLTVGWINSTMWKAFRVPSHIWKLPSRFPCSGWPRPHGLIRHHWTRRCSEERKEIWTDLGGGEAEMWEQFSKAFTQQVFLVTKISISNPTDWEAF